MFGGRGGRLLVRRVRLVMTMVMPFGMGGVACMMTRCSMSGAMPLTLHAMIRNGRRAHRKVLV